uniref:Transducin beta like 3 n=1 Tax=Takifugu rubripes TaxID=31033 RepID=A0A674MQ57_TAKRU
FALECLLLCYSYAVSSKIEPFYKGGKVQVSKDENYIFCTCGSRINVLEISTGKIVHSVEHDDQEDITSFALSSDDELLVTASRALLLKQWDWRQAQCTRSWRAIHTAPVASMDFDSTSTLLATGGCDGTIKIWDVVKQYCTHNLRGSSGVVHLVQFHPDISRLKLFSSSMDCSIWMWDLSTSLCVCMLQSHYSAVTSLSFSPDGDTMISSGRDKICTVWDLKQQNAKRAIPVYEAVEGVIFLPENQDFSQIGVKNPKLHFVTAGSKGILRVWDPNTARCVFSQTLGTVSVKKDDEEGEEEEKKDDNPRSLTHLLLLPASSRLATVTAEHNITLYQLAGLTTLQQFVGYNDEVLDVKFLGKDDSHIVVATNSCQLKVFELLTNSCQILYGHTDTVLSLDVFRKGSLFASCAKDRSVCVWQMDSGHVRCVARGTSHTNAVGCISCSRMKASFVASGSLDCTVKVWDLPADLTAAEESIQQLTLRTTEKAHDKDVNSVAVSPNDKLLASASQDRTAKLWSLAGEGNLGLLGVFRGHRRGVWTVCFSPVDQVLATSSADGTTKLWSLQDFSCLKTFEGHDASVLKVIFVSRGTQLLTSGSDGLVKLWTIKTNECVKTLDAHQDKVWGLHGNRRDNRMVTGSADSNITVWEVMCIYVPPLPLCVCVCVCACVEALLRYCGVWNTNAKNCQDAQVVLQVLLTHVPPEELLQYQGARTHLEGLVPYTERHMQRIGRLLQASMFLNYMWQKMRDRGDVENREGEDRDSGQDEDPSSPLEDEEEEDADVSTTRRVSARIQSKEGGKTNGRHPSVSEESSEEEDMDEEEEEEAGKAAKRLSASSTLSQTIAS